MKAWTPSPTVAVALRGGPITSDATMEDGEVIGLGEVADRILCAGPDTLGISWEERSVELGEAMEWADVILAKGQANYYVFSEYSGELQAPVVCLLSTKCRLVSGKFGEELLINVAKLLSQDLA